MNLAQLFASQRRLINFDCETTGTDPWKDRIVELAFEVHHPDGRVDEWQSLVNPGVPIPEGATRVHGITDERMRQCQHCQSRICDCESPKLVPSFKQLAPRLAKGFTDCDLAGKNILRFDLPLLAAEFERAGVEWDWRGARIVDLDRLEQLAEPRDLSSLVKRKLGREHVGAHGALADIKATGELIAYDLEHYPLERDLAKLHALQFPGLVDLGGKIRMRDGEPTVTFGKWAGKAMRQVDADYWRWIADKSDMPAEMKRLARAAMEGRYPQ